MRKATLIAVLFGLGMLLPVLPASAGETMYRFDPATQTSRPLDFPNTWAGYKIFRKRCKSCHHRGNAVGAPFLYTESKTARAWNRVFFKKYPKCAKDGSWAGLSREDLAKLNDYLYMTARDMYDPADAKYCG